MGTVSASATLGSLVDLDALHDEVAGVKTLGIGVGLSVLEKIKDEFGGLDGPTSLADTPLLAYSSRVSDFLRIENWPFFSQSKCAASTLPLPSQSTTIFLQRCCFPPIFGF